MTYDCAIIGGGPAGLSAALTLKVHRKNFIWLGSMKLSDKINKAERIMNYPGLPAVTGSEMSEVFHRQMEEMNIEITDLMVNSIMSMGSTYAIMAGSEFYEAKTVILTTGVANTATLQGEQEMVGAGVSYCATCDGGLYRGKKIAVLCGHSRFEHEVRYLAELAAEVLYIPMYKDVGEFPENVRILGSRAVEILHDKRVTGIRLTDGSEEQVNGVFILRESVALATLLPGLETEKGHIKVDRSMQTNLPGVYAAGDCTGRPYQYTKAVGEGNVAAHNVVAYLD